MKIGYARVSTEEQNLDLQIDYLKSKGVNEKLIFIDKCSGTVSVEERKGFNEMMTKLRAEDEIHVYKLDRISRKAKSLKDILRDFNDKGVHICASDVPELENVPQNMRDLVTDIVVSILSFTAETEREFIKERQKRGIAEAKKNNVYKGKPFEYSSNARDPKKRIVYQNVINQLNNNEAISKIAKENGITRQTVYAIKKRSLVATN